MFIHQILFSVLWAYHYGVEIEINLSKGAYCWVGNLVTAQACQKSTVHSSTIRTPCRRHQKTTGKIKCTPSSPKKYSATGQKNHTRVFLTQKKTKIKQNNNNNNNNKKSIHVPPPITVRMVRSYLGRVQSACPWVPMRPASRHIIFHGPDPLELQ